jgi:chromosome segregation ATPase
MEHQRTLDSEKEAARSKIKTIEDKLKDSENRKNTQMIELEAEKARITSEKNYFKNHCRELEDKIGQLEKAKERLLIENEKHKSERRSVMRNQSYASVLGQSKQWNNSQSQSQAPGGPLDASLVSDKKPFT